MGKREENDKLTSMETPHIVSLLLSVTEIVCAPSQQETVRVSALLMKTL